jgi:hypothetical protein
MFFNNPVRIYDCSNSVDRPQHRGGGGPVMNDVMRYLHEYAEDYYCEFVDDPEHAEVIITNDVFPKVAIDMGVPLVKRMCGPFWQRDMQSRNDSLNLAASQADMVIFISDYSKRQYFYNKCPDLKNHCVVRHWVDYNIFKPDNFMPSEHEFMLTACATNWNRKEKRFDDLVKFAEMNPGVQFALIGEVDVPLPKNMMKMGYLSDPSNIAYILQSSDGFVNFSYRDAATKTVPQAIACGLPVLYADSGGVGEMVKNPFPDSGPDFGIPILDSHYLGVEDEVPPLDMDEVQKSFFTFRHNLGTIKTVSLESFDRKLAFIKMLDSYFGIISNMARQ